MAAFVAADYAINDVIEQLLAYANTLPLMKPAITIPSEQTIEETFPFAVVRFESARVTVHAGSPKWMSTIIVQIHCSPRPTLAAEKDAAMPYGPAFGRILAANPTVAALASHIETIVAEFGPLEYPDGTFTQGWTFRVETVHKLGII